MLHFRIAAMAKPADVEKEGGIQTTEDVWKAFDFSESTRKKLPSAERLDNEEREIIVAFLR